MNQWKCTDGMHHAKNRGDIEIPLQYYQEYYIYTQSCITLCLDYGLGEVTHDCASIYP